MAKILELDKFKELKSLAKAKSVLVITKDDIVFVRLHSILKHFFDVIDFVEDFSEATEKFLNFNYEFIIVDVKNNKDKINESFAFVNEVKFITKSQSVVLISKNSEKDFLLRVVNHDISGFVEYPIDPRLLLYRLSVILEEKRMAEMYPSLNQKKRVAQNIKRLKFPTRVCNLSDCDTKEVVEEVPKVIKPKVSIQEFLKDLKHENYQDWETFERLDDIFEQLVHSMEESIYMIVDGKVNDEILAILSQDFASLHKEISVFEQFKNIAEEIYEVYNIFIDNFSDGVDSLSENQSNALSFLEYLFEDIKSFLNAIFIKQNAENIEIFYPQIKSGVEQINSILSKGTTSSEDEDDLDFF
jgi:AmiR/NasT family two-component response regulator